MKSPMNVLSDPSKSSPMNDAILFPGLSKAMQDRAATMMADADAMEAYMALTPMHPWRPCGLYEHMLKKVAPYTVRGVIWYQGCSDEAHADHYADLMHALILKWREDFRDPSLPFFQVQLAPFGSWLGNSGDNYPAVRSAQEKATDLTSDTWLASIGDAGMIYDIHPKHKRKPGERLGLLALRHTYGLEISADAPRAKSLSYDGNTAVICFEHGEGLTVTEPENGGLTAEEMEKYHFSDPDIPEKLPPAENLNSLIRTVPEGQVSATVAEDTLRVSLSVDGKYVKPIKIEFAQTGYYEINLKNDSGLPVFPFVISTTP